MVKTKSFSFRTDIDRNYNEVKLRNLNNANMIISPTYNKFFKWNKIHTIELNKKNLSFRFKNLFL